MKGKRYTLSVGVVGVFLVLLSFFILAQEQPPPEALLPELTPEGVKWADKVIKNSIKVVNGKPVNKPPFVDPGLADTVALVASVVKKTAEVTDLDSLPQDRDYIRLQELIQARTGAGESLTFEGLRALYEALNSQQETFALTPTAPTAFTAQAVETAGPNDLEAVKVFGGLAPRVRVAERRSEGRIEELPKRHPDQVFDMHFVNGVQTWLRDHVIETTILGLRLGADIDPLHNEAGLLPFDILQAWLNDIKISKDLARLAVKNEVLEHARDGKPYILVCHSQGAAICAQGITEALNEAAGDVVLQDRIKKLTGVLSLGGFTQQNRFPDGIVVELVCNERDPICKLAIDFTQPVKTIKNLLLAPIDILTRWFNEHGLNTAYLRGACNDMPDIEACRGLAVIEAVLLANLRQLKCGNGAVDSSLGEICDGTNLNGQTCESQRFPGGGDLACAPNCQSFDTSGCIEQIEVEEVSTRSGWTGNVLATRKTWSSAGQQFVEVVRYGASKRICPTTGVFLDCPVTWNVWKFVPLPGRFISAGATPPEEAVVTVKPDNVITESCDDLDPQRRFSSGPADCPPKIVSDVTFISSTSPSYTFPLCFSTHSCGIYDPASPYLGQVGYTAELQTGCVSEQCPAAYACPLPCVEGNPNWPACLTEGHCPQ